MNVRETHRAALLLGLFALAALAASVYGVWRWWSGSKRGGELSPALAASITDVWKGDMTDAQGDQHPISFALRADSRRLRERSPTARRMVKRWRPSRMAKSTGIGLPSR